MIWIQIQFSPFSRLLKITQTYQRKKFNSTFSFENTYTDVVMKVINKLNVAKSCQMNDIPTKVIKMNKNIFANFITDHLNNFGEFPDELKHAVIPVHKKNEKCDKTNYRPVSILTKIYEKLIYNQLSKYFDSLLVNNQCGFRRFTVLSISDDGKVRGSNR